MREKEQSHLMGGLECGCGCDGPSSTSSNMSANYAHEYNPAHSCNYIGYDGEGMEAVCRPREPYVSSIIRLLVLLFLIGQANVLYSQRKETDAKISRDYCRYGALNRKVIGTANVRILYAFNAVDLEDKNTWIDEGQLKIARGVTQYSSHFEEVNEDNLIKWLNDHPNSSVYPPARWLQGYRKDFWIEYQYSNIKVKGNVLEEWAAMPRNIEDDNLMYSEPFPLQTWQIGTESKEICGYECQKATCRWRGRDYVAWFTMDIPVSAGPWKFGGLPGLIMKINDTGNDYSWEAVAVNTGEFPIYGARRKAYKKSTREKVLKLQRELNENYLKTTGGSKTLIRTGQTIYSRKHAYTPLELE